MEEILSNVYQKLGDFFTGSSKRRLFYLILFLILLIILNLKLVFSPIEIKFDTLFWFFGSVVQSLVALVALIAVVVIFKYQNMTTREDRLLEELNKGTSDLAIIGGDITAISSEELLKNITDRVSEKPNDDDGFRITKLRRVQKELNTNIFLRSFLANYMIRFTVYTFFVVMVNLFALAITQFLVSHSTLAIISLYISFFFVANSLRLAIKIIAGTISN